MDQEIWLIINKATSISKATVQVNYVWFLLYFLAKPGKYFKNRIRFKRNVYMKTRRNNSNCNFGTEKRNRDH